MLVLPLALGAALAAALPTARQLATGNTTIVSDTTKSYIADLYKRYSITGSVIAVVSPQGSEVISYGYSDVYGNNVTSETYWAIASNTKLFTSVAINLLIDDGVTLPNGQPLSLESRMVDIYDGFSMRNTSLNNITLLNFMTMRTGLPQHILATHSGDTPYDPVYRTQYLYSNVPAGDNGTWQYSNHDYEVISAIPQVLTGQTIDDLIQTRIFDALGMGATRDALYAKQRGRSMGFLRTIPNITACLAYLQGGGPYTSEICTGTPQAIDFWTDTANGGFYGGAGVNLRGDDMILWAKELMNPKVLPNTTLTRIKTAIPFANANQPFNSSAITEGLGYELGTVPEWYRGKKIYLHDGAVPGSESLFAWSPDTGVAVFVVGNDDALASSTNTIVQNTILDELFGLTPLAWENMTLDSGVDTSSGQSSSVTGLNSTNTTTAISPAPTGYDKTFTNGAYGDITLIPFNASSPEAYQAAGLAPDYLLTVATLLQTNLTDDAYVVQYNHTFGTHFVFNHFDGPLFNYTVIYSKPAINATGATGTYATKIYASGTAVFAENGIGIFGSFVLPGSGDPTAPVATSNLTFTAPVFFAPKA